MKMMKTDMEFVTFDAQDVITTSGELTFTVAGLGDKVRANATIVTSDGRTIYNAKDYSQSWAAKVASALDKEVEGSIMAMTEFYSNSSTSSTINVLFNAALGGGDASGSTTGSAYNGIYKWISESGYFLKQQ